MTARLGAAVLAGVMLAVAACGSDDDDVTATATLSPFPSPAAITDTPTPQQTTPPVELPTDRTEPTIFYTPDPNLLHDLDLNREKWNAAGIRDYQYGFTLIFQRRWENQPTIVVVHDGELDSITDTSGALVTPNPDYDFFLSYSTVERLFQQVEDNIYHGYGVVVTYDSNYGFPTEIRRDGRQESTDSGGTVPITDFEILP